MADIIQFNNKEKTDKKFDLTVTYTDGTQEFLICSFFGASLDVPDYLVFLDGQGEEQYPNKLINSSLVKSIDVNELIEVEEEQTDG